MNQPEATYKDTRLSPEERAADLLARMNNEQKIAQLGCVFTMDGVIPDMNQAAPNGIGHIGMLGGRTTKEGNIAFTKEIQDYVIGHTAFGIPALIHSEALSGLMAREADVFPVAIGLSCTFDPEKVREMGDVIRRQMSAVGFRHALSPVLDISRDARWGRNGESYGEDPCLAGAMAAAFVGGIQGKLEEGVAATAKHFVGYGCAEGGMNMAQVTASERTLNEVYAKPFQAAITESDLQAVMNSYGSFDNEPVSSSKKLLTDMLCGEMGFDGVVVSDYVAIDRLVSPYNVAADAAEAGVLALEAGMDVEYPKPNGFSDGISKAIDEGRLDQAALDRAAYRVLRLKFRLGLFEHPYGLPENLSSYHSQSSAALNKALAEESVILLKNDGILPLSKKTKRIAVIGPHADSIRSIFGCYTYPAMYEMRLGSDSGSESGDSTNDLVSGLSFTEPGVIQPENPRLAGELRAMYPGSKTIFEAIKELLPKSTVTAAAGCTVCDRGTESFGDALKLAKKADVVILTLGGKNGWGPTCTIGEGIDSANIGLPGVQREFAEMVAALGKPTVVVHMDGRPISDEFVVKTFPAIIEAWQPGEYGGQAIASVIFGDVNPSGRLSTTAARCSGQLPIYYGLHRNCGYEGAGQVGMVVNPNGYADISAQPLYHFGHGLSYTTFEYSELKFSNTQCLPTDELSVSVSIKNTGDRAGDEVAQLYISDCLAGMSRPVKELQGFCRVHLEPGESKTVRFALPMSQLAFLDKDMRWKIEKGEFRADVGAASDDTRLSGSFTVTEDGFTEGRSRGFFARCTVEQE